MQRRQLLQVMGAGVLAGLVAPTGGSAGAAVRVAGPVPGQGVGPGSEPVAVRLVLAIDASASVTGGGLEFQLRGHAAAFQDDAVAASVVAGGALVTLISFSGPGSLKQLIPWTRLTDEASVKGFGQSIAKVPRDGRADATAIGSAIDAATGLFDQVRDAGGRTVIDLVSNGFSNAGTDPSEARDRAVARGITINGLAILDEFPWLEEYFNERVIGGDNAFVLSAYDRDSFVDALRRKLVLEMSAIPVSPDRLRA